MLPHQLRPVPPPCESCGQKPGTEETYCPPFGGLPETWFLLCEPCKSFSDGLHGLVPFAAQPWGIA